MGLIVLGEQQVGLAKAPEVALNWGQCWCETGLNLLKWGITSTASWELKNRFGNETLLLNNLDPHPRGYISPREEGEM